MSKLCRSGAISNLKNSLVLLFIGISIFGLYIGISEMKIFACQPGNSLRKIETYTEFGVKTRHALSSEERSPTGIKTTHNVSQFFQNSSSNLPIVDVTTSLKLQLSETLSDAIKSSSTTAQPQESTFLPTTNVTTSLTSQPPETLSVNDKDNIHVKNKIYLTAPMAGYLGNNMWIYQSVHGIAKHNDMIPSFVASELGLLRQVFDLSHHGQQMMMTEETSLKFHNGGRFDHQETIPTFQQNTKIGRYLQNLDYFHGGNIEELRAFWKLHPRHVMAAQEILPANSMCIHRRYFPSKHTANKCPSEEHLRDAILRVRRPEQQLLVFTHDVKLAEKEFLNKTKDIMVFGPQIVKRNSLGEDLPTSLDDVARDFAALTLCQDLVITCGSFGGFAGLLHRGSGEIYHFNDPVLLRTFREKLTSKWTYLGPSPK